MICSALTIVDQFSHHFASNGRIFILVTAGTASHVIAAAQNVVEIFLIAAGQ